MARFKDLREVISDNWSDFCETVYTVCSQKNLPQILAASVIVIAFAVGMILIWLALSVLLAFPVWALWNIALPGLGVPEIGYWQAYCLTMLSAILIRGNSITITGVE